MEKGEISPPTTVSEKPATVIHNHGFSLVELLIVVAILAILATIAIPLFLNQRKKADEATVRQQVALVRTSVISGLSGKSDTILGADGEPYSNFGELTFGNEFYPKYGVSVYIDFVSKNWCLSQTATSGKNFVSTIAHTGVYEGQTVCANADSTPAELVSSADIVAAEPPSTPSAVQPSTNLASPTQITVYNSGVTGWVIENPNTSPIIVSPNTTYTVSFDISDAPSETVYVVINWYDAGQNLISSSESKRNQVDRNTGLVAYTAISPNNTYYATLQIKFPPGIASNRAFTITQLSFVGL